MVTELQQALRDAVDDPPRANFDLASVVVAGAQRVHRRRVRRATVAALGVVAAGAVAWASLETAPHTEPVLPSRPGTLEVPTTLNPDGARKITPDVLATTRVLWLDPANELDYDRYDGLTADGQVVRARYTYKGDVSEFGLLDPATGRTDWLPRPSWDLGEPRPLDFSLDRLLYVDNRSAWADALLSFDRATRTWSRVDIVKPPGTDRFFGMRAVLGPNDTVYLLNPASPEAGQWWTVPAARGGKPTEVDGLAGLAIAWNARGDLATVDDGGRVVVTTAGRARVVATARPKGCDAPDAADFSAPTIGYAGTRMVVTYSCRGSRSDVVAFGPDGRPQLAIERAGGVVATGTRWVLLSANTGPGPTGTPTGRLMALNLDDHRLLTIGSPLHDDSADVAGDLVLWGAARPSDNSSTYDVVYRVARLR